jgi:3-deoxy-D-manno-octulosonate 8-phosphate phosphatase (KDO 8-P phosphatase)
MKHELQAKLSQIRLLICDVDGVLTDGYLYLTNQELEVRAFHVHDGQGLKHLLRAGIEIGIITTSNTPIIQKRMDFLGIKYVYMGQHNKNAAFNDLIAKTGLDLSEVAYIGDDLPDLPLIRKVGLGAAVSNALPAVRQEADWVSQFPGGQGAVRELCDLLLQAQEKWERVLRDYE